MSVDEGVSASVTTFTRRCTGGVSSTTWMDDVVAFLGVGAHRPNRVDVGAPVVVFIVVVVGGSIPPSPCCSLILLSAAPFASFRFARLRAMRSWALALRRSMMVAAASHSLILLSAARSFFFLFRAAMSHALTGASSLEVDDGCYGLHCGLLPD